MLQQAPVKTDKQIGQLILDDLKKLGSSNYGVTSTISQADLETAEKILFVQEPEVKQEISRLEEKSKIQDFEALANKLELDMTNAPRKLIAERNKYFDERVSQIQSLIKSFNERTKDITDVKVFK